jgi:hypothetical protein
MRNSILGALRAFCLVALLAVTASAAHATLIDNGDGTITQIRDDGSRLIWLENADLAGSTMNWWDAMSWAEDLVYAGRSDWRLPTSDECFGYNCTESEMGYLYYTELGNVAGGPMSNSGPFTNVQAFYWSATEAGPDAAGVFWFNHDLQGGFQSSEYKEPDALADLIHVWAVVPEPSTALLLAFGLVGIAAKRKTDRIL